MDCTCFLTKNVYNVQAGADPGAIAPTTKTYENYFIHYDFVQFGKQR